MSILFFNKSWLMWLKIYTTFFFLLFFFNGKKSLSLALSISAPMTDRKKKLHIKFIDNLMANIFCMTHFCRKCTIGELELKNWEYDYVLGQGCGDFGKFFG